LQLSSQTFPEGENPEVEYYTKLRNRQLCCKSCVQIPWIYAKMNFEVLSGHQKNSFSMPVKTENDNGMEETYLQ